ncbi:MAG: hypothetical protein ABUT20_19525 [Bacteroidota bacterium]
MKKSLHISASFDEPLLVENMIEQLAYRRNEQVLDKIKMPKGWEANETSSTEAYVSGTIELNNNEDEQMRIPFITCFLFTCTRGEKEPYTLNWSISLS